MRNRVKRKERRLKQLPEEKEEDEFEIKSKRQAERDEIINMVPLDLEPAFKFVGHTIRIKDLKFYQDFLTKRQFLVSISSDGKSGLVAEPLEMADINPSLYRWCATLMDCLVNGILVKGIRRVAQFCKWQQTWPSFTKDIVNGTVEGCPVNSECFRCISLLFRFERKLKIHFTTHVYLVEIHFRAGGFNRDGHFILEKRKL